MWYKMKKPKKKIKEYLDYHECQKWIEHKYKVDLRDYARKFKGDKNWNDDSIPYQDFWHSILDWSCENINNGCYFYLNVDTEGYSGYSDIEDWEKEILNMFAVEFKEHIDGDGCIEFWTEW